MRVAVITPSYRTPRAWLDQCVQSVADQSHRCTHFLVSDGDEALIPLSSANVLAPSNLPEVVGAFAAENFRHVEGNASVLLRHLIASGEEITSARLFLNRDALCGACMQNISEMVPSGVRLEVIGTLAQGAQRQAIPIRTVTGTGSL
jgi:hypothetical protein